MPGLQIVVKNDVLVLAAWILCWFLPQMAALLGCVSKRVFLFQHYQLLGRLTNSVRGRSLSSADEKYRGGNARRIFLKSELFSFFSEAAWWLAHLLTACFMAPLFAEVIEQYSPQDSVPFVLFLCCLGYTAWWAWLANTYLCYSAHVALSYAALLVVAVSNCACVLLIRVTFPEHHIHHWFPLGQLVACAAACIATRQCYKFRNDFFTYESTPTFKQMRSSQVPQPPPPPPQHHHHQHAPSLWTNK